MLCVMVISMNSYKLWWVGFFLSVVGAVLFVYSFANGFDGLPVWGYIGMIAVAIGLTGSILLLVTALYRPQFISKVIHVSFGLSMVSGEMVSGTFLWSPRRSRGEFKAKTFNHTFAPFHRTEGLAFVDSRTHFNEFFFIGGSIDPRNIGAR